MVSERRLGLPSATALVVANMIGAGVFTTSGLLIAELHSAWWVLLVWALGGLAAISGALCYGVLAQYIPESGGECVYLSRTLHPALGYLAGWVTFLVGFAVPLAALAYAFGQYLTAMPGMDGVSPRLSGTVVILVAAAVHAFSLTAGARTQAIAVGIELVVITLFTGFGMGQVVSTGLQNSEAPGHLGGLGVALVVVSYAYQGWNSAAYVGGEVANPKRNLPRAMVWGAAIVTVLYLGLNAVFVLGTPTALLAGKVDAGRIAALVLGGPGLAKLVSGLIAFVLIICISSVVMAGPQVVARMAADGFLPRVLATQAGRPPRIALLIQVAIALFALWTTAFASLLTYVGFTLNLIAAATVVGLGWQRYKHGPALAVPGWPWVPALFVLFVFGSTVFTTVERPRESLVGFATLALGLAAYAVHKRAARRA
jgi:basic amino acid/polyamine antiporter, APA family